MTEQNKGTWGTIKFDGAMATLGFALNKMCYSFNTAEAREEFKKDEASYCDKFGLTSEQKEAVIKRDILELERLGGSIYYLSKFAGVLGLNVQDVGGIQTGRTTEEFQAYLDSQGEESTMAKIIGGIGTSHIPAIGIAMNRGLEDTPYWKDFFAGYPPIRKWLDEQKPDIAIVFYNDHGLEMFLDKKPTFAIGCAPSYENADEGWGIATIPPVTGETELSWHIANELVEQDFDPTICQDIKVDHGLTVPLSLMYPGHNYQHLKVIPVCINCERYPMPKPSRCYALGQAIGKAVESFAGDQKVVVLGTGGLSHQLDGERAGFMNTDFDLDSMDKLVNDPEALTKYSNDDLVAIAGAQGVEWNMWLGMRGCLRGKVTELHRNYVAPISNTGAGTQLLLNE